MNSTPWARSDAGMVFGVCQGIAERLQVDVMLVRLTLVFAVLFFGTGLLVYVVLAFSLPKKSNLESAAKAKILGVSSRFAKRFDLDIGLVRAIFLMTLICSGGSFFLAYLIMYIVLPSDSELKI